MDVERASAAQRRRGRRLRAALRHERQSIAMALAESQHHTSRGQKKARAGEEGHRNEYEAPRRQKPPPPPAFFRLFDEEDAERGLRPACLAEPRGPQERVQLRTVEHIADVVPMVQILDAPVPQVGEQGVLEAFRHLDLLIPEQVIEVPMFSSPCGHCRRRRLPVQQMVEQLVEVPEFVSSVLVIHRQIADIPIPQVGCRSSGGFQGFLPGQDYFLLQEVHEQIVDITVSQGRRGKGGGLQSSLPVLGSSAVCGADHVEQLVDIPVRGDVQGFLPGQGSSASSSGLHDCAVDGIQGVFRTFPRIKKSPNAPSSLSPGVHASVSSSTRAPQVRLWPWVMVLSGTRLYFWNRFTGVTCSELEEGFLASWLLRPDGFYVRLADGTVFETIADL